MFLFSLFTKKTKLFAILIFIITVILGTKYIIKPPIIHAVVSEATIKIHVKNNFGQSMANISIICNKKNSNSSKNYYLKTNSAGYASLSIFPNGNDVFKCYLSKTSYCINNKYFYRQTSSTGSFTLNPGDIKTFTFSYKFIKYCNTYPKYHKSRPTPKPTPKLTPKPSPKAPISKIKLPKKLLEEGIKISNLNYTTRQAKSIKNFTIQKKETAQIKFIETIDLSSDKVAEKFKNLDKYIKISNGRIFINSKELPWLNKKAQITFYNIKLAPNTSKIKLIKIENSKIYLLDSSKNKISYDFKNKKLSFIVNGFSEYVLTPSLDPNIKIIEEFKGLEHYLILFGKVSDLTSKINVYLAENPNINCKNRSTDPNGNWTCKIKLPNKRLKDNIIIQAKNKSNYTQTVKIPIALHYFTTTKTLSNSDIKINIFNNWVYYTIIGTTTIALLSILYFYKLRHK